MKVTYEHGDKRYRTTAYLNDEALPDGSYVGTNKHTDLPVHLRWSDERDVWIEVCHREFSLVDIYNERYEEVGERPECSCVEVQK